MMLLTYQYDAPPFRIPLAASGGPMSQALSRGLELWQVQLHHLTFSQSLKR